MEGSKHHSAVLIIFLHKSFTDSIPFIIYFLKIGLFVNLMHLDLCHHYNNIISASMFEKGELTVLNLSFRYDVSRAV